MKTKVFICFCILVSVNEALASKWWPYETPEDFTDSISHVLKLASEISQLSKSPVVEQTASPPPMNSPQQPTHKHQTPPVNSSQEPTHKYQTPPVDVAESVAQLFYVAIRDSLRLLEKYEPWHLNGGGYQNSHPPPTTRPTHPHPHPPSSPLSSPIISPTNSPAPSNRPSRPTSYPTPSTSPASSPLSGTSPANSPTSTTGPPPTHNSLGGAACNCEWKI